MTLVLAVCEDSAAMRSQRLQNSSKMTSLLPPALDFAHMAVLKSKADLSWTGLAMREACRWLWLRLLLPEQPLLIGRQMARK